ncbi:ABC transporter permease subunit [Kaustia mangrovi]|uniref:ABC transporter permease subunit n=1 Tax=Kaustia mangrovi TaxID=2593653 RepID=A0A7S8HCS9_9HYPH|nr:ABC transporter permease subunit [Kaustia mangrovi]QPC43769.1 ABC transporter permease subunit [Kaustia mangrovi]
MTTAIAGSRARGAFAGLFQRLGRPSASSALLVAPAVCFIAAFFILPMGELFLASIGYPDITVASYRQFFSQGGYFQVLVRTVTAGFAVTGICLVLGFPLAYAIAMSSGAWRTVMLLLVVVPYLTSLLVRTYAWIVMLGDGGVINKTLIVLGLTDAPVQILYTSLGAYIGMVHIMLPFMVLPILSVMNGLDDRLVPAAKSMGAGPVRAFVRVFLPLTVPGIKSGSILVFILAIGFYITPAALGGLSDVLLSQLIEIQVSQAMNFRLAAAAAFVLLLVTAGFLLLFGADFTSARSGLIAGGADRRTAGLAAMAAGLVRKAVSRVSASTGVTRAASGLRRSAWRRALYRRDLLMRVRPALVIAYAAAGLFFLILPSLIVLVMSFSSDPFLSFPPSGLSLRWYEDFFADRSWTSALGQSVFVALASTALSCGLGIMAAYALDRHPRLGRYMMPLLLAPIIVPIIVVGVALYGGFVGWGLIGTDLGLILAHTLGGISYVVIIVCATLAGFDRRLERAAMSMGAGPVTTFRRITLPLIQYGIVAGAIFAFIHSFDEVVVATFIGGFGEKTLPMKMWEDIRHQINPTIAAVSTMLLLVPVLGLIGLRFTADRRK